MSCEGGGGQPHSDTTRPETQSPGRGEGGEELRGPESRAIRVIEKEGEGPESSTEGDGTRPRRQV